MGFEKFFFLQCIQYSMLLQGGLEWPDLRSYLIPSPAFVIEIMGVNKLLKYTINLGCFALVFTLPYKHTIQYNKLSSTYKLQIQSSLPSYFLFQYTFFKSSPHVVLSLMTSSKHNALVTLSGHLNYIPCLLCLYTHFLLGQTH